MHVGGILSAGSERGDELLLSVAAPHRETSQRVKFERRVLFKEMTKVHHLSEPESVKTERHIDFQL